MENPHPEEVNKAKTLRSEQHLYEKKTPTCSFTDNFDAAHLQPTGIPSVLKHRTVLHPALVTTALERQKVFQGQFTNRFVKVIRHLSPIRLLSCYSGCSAKYT